MIFMKIFKFIDGDNISNAKLMIGRKLSSPVSCYSLPKKENGKLL